MDIKELSLPEKIVFILISTPFLFYITGTIFPVYSTFPWLLFIVTLIGRIDSSLSLFFKESKQREYHVSWVIWIWFAGMSVIAISTLIGLVNFGYDFKEVIRSLLSWSRQWALLFLFPFLGASLHIRPAVIYRGACLVCFQCLLLFPFGYLAAMIGLPSLLYSSPLERLTQNGSIFYNITLYLQNEYTNEGVRLALFTPWAPALGLLGNIYFFFSLREKDRFWRLTGTLGSLSMIFISASRSSLVFLPAVLIVVCFLGNIRYIKKPASLFSLGIMTFLLGLFSSQLIQIGDFLKETFVGARKDSSRVRDTLQRIALDRFSEAPIWGHGKQKPGFELVANMPIGSHHTWIGLLFTHGLVGLFAFLIPLWLTIITLIIQSIRCNDSRTALSFILTLSLFTMTDNQEVLAYLYWPGLLLTGYVLSNPKVTINGDLE